MPTDQQATAARLVSRIIPNGFSFASYDQAITNQSTQKDALSAV
jgi:hypothetical protein